jgi:hypothetical protein
VADEQRLKEVVSRNEPDVNPYKSDTPIVVSPKSSASARVEHGIEPTLTSSNGALPTQTTAPLAPPAIKLVIATSFAEFPLNQPSFRSTHGASTSFSFPLRDELEMGRAWPGEEFRIRFVEV